MPLARLRAVCAGLVLALLAGCGGGGGDSRGPLLPTLSRDTVPAGTRIDVSALDLFPSGAGDVWVYDRVPAQGASATVTRSVVEGPDADGWVVLREADATTSTDIVQRLTADGLEQFDPLGARDTWPGAFDLLPSFIEYPTPLYPQGGERRILRQGSLGADEDGDGRDDYFRAEIVQVFEGFETMEVMGLDVQVARFSNTVAFTSALTRTGDRYTATTTEHTWFEPGIGLVRADRSAVGSDGEVLVEPYSILLRSATVDGQDYETVSGAGQAPAQAAAPVGPRPAASRGSLGAAARAAIAAARSGSSGS
jgi:hypothetical protein